MSRWWRPAASVILMAGVAFVAVRTHAAPVSGSQVRYAVILVLDGARPDYFTLARMPHLRWLESRGVRYSEAFVGQEIANTPPSHATIGTGVFPSHHGVQGFVWTDPRTHLMTRPADIPAVLNGALEQVMTSNHVPSLAASLKAADPSAKVLAVSGHKCYAADAMGTARADYILCSLIYHDRWVAQAVGSHRPPPGAINNPRWDVPIPAPSSGFAPAVEQWNLTQENDWTVRYALWAFRRVHYPRLMMINLPETDVTGHFAVDPRKTEGTLMTSFDKELAAIIDAYRRAGILSRTVFVVTADHGMSRARSRLPFSLLDQAITSAGATKVWIEADTGAMIGIRELDKARAVALKVAALGGIRIDATFYKTVRHGLWSYHLASARHYLPPELIATYRALADTMASATGPDVVAVYAPHITTGDRPAHGYHWLAGHLGPQWDEQHIPLVIEGAGVRRDVVSPYAARLVDIAPTVERLLGLSTARVDGVVLSDSLVDGSRADRSAQARRGRELAPMVRALEQRSS